MINKAWETRAHAQARTHRQESRLPSLKLLTPCQDRSVTLGSPPPHPLHPSRVRVYGRKCRMHCMGVITNAHLQDICALLKHHAYCFSYLTADITSYKQKTFTAGRLCQTVDKMHDKKNKCAGTGGKMSPYLNIWPFCREEEASAALWWHEFNCRFTV